MNEEKSPYFPKIVTLCGSSRFCDVMAVVAWILERDEGSITVGLHLLPYWYSPDLPDDHLAEHENCAEAMDALHLSKIRISDEVFVVDVGGYIGESTSREIEFAESLGLKIRYYTKDPIGEKLRDIMASYFGDKIRGMTWKQ